jgi:hypothetical protein
LNAFISRSTLFDALGLYFLVLDFFLLEDFLAADFVRLLELDFLIAMDVFPLAQVGSSQFAPGCRYAAPAIFQ